MSEIIIDEYFEEAKKRARKIYAKVALTSVVLDNWNGVRLIYGAPWIEICQSLCENCPLCLAVGVEKKEDEIPEERFRTTLVELDDERRKFVPSKQFYLNCKTLAQYRGSFINCLEQECKTQELTEEELRLVRDFRIVFLAGNKDEEDLRKAEKMHKQMIIKDFLKLERLSKLQRRVAEDYAHEIRIL